MKAVNGITSWQETHFEMVQAIVLTLETSDSVASRVQDAEGHGGLYELAEEWTNEFEDRHKGRAWDGEYYDEIDKFLDEKFSQR
jgi:hypothetical protein